MCPGLYICRLLLGYYICIYNMFMYTMMILEGPQKTLSTDRPFLLAHRPQPFITVMNSAAAHRLLNHNFSRTRSSIAFSPPRKYIYIHLLVSLATYVRVAERAQGSNLYMWAYIYIYIHTLSPPLLLSSSLLFSPFLRFVYYYIFPFSCHRRHRFPMGVQSITLAWNAIALSRHVYHWSRARSYPPRCDAHRFQRVR